MDAVNGVVEPITSQPDEVEKNTNEIPSTDSITSTAVDNTESIDSSNKKRPLTTTVENEGNPTKVQKGDDGTKVTDKQTTVTNEEGEGETETDAGQIWPATNENLAKLFDSIPDLNKKITEGDAERTAETSEQGKEASSSAATTAAAPSAANELTVGDQTQQDSSFASASGMVGDESGMTMDDSMGDVNEVLYARNGRPLNRTKRAAQNRAAQRAFRARRDEYVRQTEEKAKLTDGAVETAKKLKNRLDQSNEIIAKYRDQNEELRKMVESLGGNPPPTLSIELPPLDLSLKEDEKEEKMALDPSLSGKGIDDTKPERKTAEENASDLASLSAVAVAAAASVLDMEQASKNDEANKVEGASQ